MTERASFSDSEPRSEMLFFYCVQAGGRNSMHRKFVARANSFRHRASRISALALVALVGAYAKSRVSLRSCWEKKNN